MATIATLLEQLRSVARIEDSDNLDQSQLELFLTQAMTQHNTGYTYASLPASEEEAVVILAWIRVCLDRATRAAITPGTSGPNGFGQEGESVYSKNTRLADKLRERYAALTGALRVRSSEGVTLGTLLRDDDELDAQVPLSASVSPSPVILSAPSGQSDTVGTTHIVEWSSEWYSNFSDYLLFHVEGATSLFQAHNFNSDSGVPRILNGATLVASFSDQDQKSCQISELDKSQTNRFLIVSRSRSGKYSYSNELVLNG